MLRSLHLLAVTACLADASVFPAMADIVCPHFEVTDGQEIYASDILAWITEKGGGRDAEHRCMSEEKVHLSVKGDLRDGETVAVEYFPDSYECSSSPSEGPPHLVTYYRDRDGSLKAPACYTPPARVVVEAYMRRKAELERDARSHPRDLAKQMELARFFVGWNDLSRAAPAVTKVAELAPGAPETRLLEARLLLLSQPDELDARKRALPELVALARNVPMARLLAERTRSEIALESQRQPNGLLPQGAVHPAISVPGLDLSGRDMTGTWLPDAELADLVAPRSDWTAAGLESNDLSGANLQEAIFTEANLNKATLADADLQRARFVRAIVAEADFSGARMQRAVMRQVGAFEARFTSADLRGAEVGGNFSGADFTNADLRGADLREASAIEVAVLTGARFDCLTRFPRGFEPEKRGMVFADKSVCIGGEQAGK